MKKIMTGILMGVAGFLWGAALVPASQYEEEMKKAYKHIPHQFHFQGYLLDEQGQPVTHKQDVTFQFYRNSRTVKAVEPRSGDGFFSIDLELKRDDYGDMTSDSVTIEFEDQKTGVKRSFTQKFATAPYALMAGDVCTSADLPVAGDITEEDKGDQWGDTWHINGSLTCNTISIMGGGDSKPLNIDGNLCGTGTIQTVQFESHNPDGVSFEAETLCFKRGFRAKGTVVGMRVQRLSLVQPIVDFEPAFADSFLLAFWDDLYNYDSVLFKVKNGDGERTYGQNTPAVDRMIFFVPLSKGDVVELWCEGERAETLSECFNKVLYITMGGKP